MKLVYEAKVYTPGNTAVQSKEVARFCDDEGINWTPDGLTDNDLLPEVAGRLCYMSFNNPRPGGNAAYLKHVLESGHGSVLEHAVFGFVFTGVSRSLSHELVRHRAGFAYSQLSQRYVDESDVAFVVPPELQEEVRAAEVYTKTHKKDARAVLAMIRENRWGSWSEVPTPHLYGLNWIASCEASVTEYKAQTEYLFDKLGGSTIPIPPAGHGTYPRERTEVRKRARQTARSVLPNCTETKIFVTGNARAWRNFLEQRGSRHAEVEIRRLAYKVWNVLVREAPNLFSDYVWTMQADGRPVDVSTPYEKV